MFVFLIELSFIAHCIINQTILISQIIIQQRNSIVLNLHYSSGPALYNLHWLILGGHGDHVRHSGILRALPGAVPWGADKTASRGAAWGGGSATARHGGHGQVSHC